MKQKRVFSMLYGAVAGFLLFAAAFIGWSHYCDFVAPWHTSTDFDRYSSFPEGTQYEGTNSHGGFLGDGVTFITAQIPADASREFEQLLWEKRFTDKPLPEKIQAQLNMSSETRVAASHPNSLWWFEDESPDEADIRN